MTNSNRKLLVHAVTVQVALTWFDGEELTPGPPLEPVTVSLSQARTMLDGLRDEVAKLAEHIAAQEPETETETETETS
jgi:hypothetical protein